jgi:hypothetical protein
MLVMLLVLVMLELLSSKPMFAVLLVESVPLSDDELLVKERIIVSVPCLSFTAEAGVKLKTQIRAKVIANFWNVIGLTDLFKVGNL